MRAGIGLVGILIAIGALVYVLGSKNGGLDQQKAAIDAGQKAEQQVNQMAGRDANGNSVKQSATLEVQTRNGATDGILVTSLTAESPYATFWGLKRNDVITEIGPLPVQQVVTDASAADDYVMDAYQHQSPLTVVRDGQKMTLPAANAAAKPAASPMDQLNAIQNGAIPTH